MVKSEWSNPFTRRGYKVALTRGMLYANKWKGHNSYFIYGRRASGKSTYALLALYSVYKDWDKCLEYLKFTRRQILEKLMECIDTETGQVIKRIPALAWDDATYENLRTRKYDPFMDSFVRLYTVIRSVVANFVWTAPSFTLVPSKLQNLDWLLIRIKRTDPTYSTAYFYRYNKAPYGSTYLPPVRIGDQQLVENFWFEWIPNKVRAKYEHTRDQYAVTGIQDLKKALEYAEQDEALNADWRKELEKYLNKVRSGKDLDTEEKEWIKKQKRANYHKKK